MSIILIKSYIVKKKSKEAYSYFVIVRRSIMERISKTAGAKDEKESANSV